MKEIQYLIDAGLCPIPLDSRAKKPKHTDWTKAKVGDYQPPDFAPDDNVGVVLGPPSNNIVDIDLDNPIARRIADLILPETGWSYGRESTPKAHRLYGIEGETGATRRFATCQTPAAIGGDKATIIEYRAGGSQSMVPPSVHPGGEAVRWDEFTEAGRTDRQTLLRACGCIAAVVELVPHYRPGTRQDFALALSGTLHQAGLCDEDTGSIIEGLCLETNDDELDKRLDAVIRTYDRGDAGLHCQGRTQLLAFLGDGGDQVLARVFQHLDLKAISSKPTRSKPARDVFDDEAAGDISDTAIAKAYSAYAAGQVLYDKSADRYFVYQPSKGVWEEDPKRLRVLPHFDQFLVKYAGQLHKNDRKGLKKYRNRGPAMAALDQAQSYLARQGVLDPDDLIIGVQNGAIDLRTGKLLPPSPQHYLTRRLEVHYDPAASCPNFQAFQNETFAGDPDLIGYVMGLAGYCLTARTDRQELYMLHACLSP